MPHLDYIIELRRSGWPYKAIARKLLSDREVTISVSALHDFCRRRGITEITKPEI